MSDFASSASSVASFSFIIPGDPRRLALQRARATRFRAGARLYDPVANRQMKKLVRYHALEAGAVPAEPWLQPLSLSIVLYWPIPSSFTKRQRTAAEHHDLHPTARPDLSNIAKLIEDALTGLLYRDDSQIVVLIVQKFYDPTPHTYILVRSLVP